MRQMTAKDWLFMLAVLFVAPAVFMALLYNANLHAYGQAWQAAENWAPTILPVGGISFVAWMIVRFLYSKGY